MMFKNAMIFLIAPGFRIDATLLTRQIARECGATESRTDGFAQPCEHSTNGLVHVVAGHQLICLQTEERLLPSSVIADAVKERADDIEAEQGFRIGRKQMKEIKERVTQELLPQAFITKKRTFALLAGEYFIIDTSSGARADTLIASLCKALEVPLSALRTVVAPASAMTDWLLSGESPSGFTIGRDCELSSHAEEKSTVRYVRHDLGGEEIRAHIADGKNPVRLAMTWNDRISFVLTDQMIIKRLAFLDILKEQAEQEAETMSDLFDIDITIMAGESLRMIDDLIGELGGIVRPEPDLVDGAQTVSKNVDECDDDPLYQQAVEIVRSTNRASISTTQRHFRIGYNRAARLIEAMEKRGIVSPMDGSGMRSVMAVESGLSHNASLNGAPLAARPLEATVVRQNDATEK